MNNSVKPPATRAARIGARVARVLMWIVAAVTVVAFIWLLKGRLSMAFGDEDPQGPMITTVFSFGVVLLSFVTILFAFGLKNAPIRHIASVIGVVATLSAAAALFGL